MLVASRLEMCGKSERQTLDAQVSEGHRALAQRLEAFDVAMSGLEQDGQKADNDRRHERVAIGNFLREQQLRRTLCYGSPRRAWLCTRRAVTGDGATMTLRLPFVTPP